MTDPVSAAVAPQTRARLAQWAGERADQEPPRELVRAVLRDLAANHPGRSVELRVPPVGAVQLVAGPVHRRGTPRATVEMAPDVLVDLVLGRRTWRDGVANGVIVASGERSDLSHLFGGT